MLEADNQPDRKTGKARFEFYMGDQGGVRVRALQGHSQNVSARIDEEAVLELVKPEDELPDRLAHGTHRKNWPSIILNGMDRAIGSQLMGHRTARTHHHFVASVRGDAQQEQEGVRGGSDTVIWVNAAAMRAAGMKILRSKTGVYLTEGIEGRILPSFVLEVRERRNDRLLYSCPHIDPCTWEAVKASQTRALEDAMVELAVKITARSDPGRPTEAAVSLEALDLLQTIRGCGRVARSASPRVCASQARAAGRQTAVGCRGCGPGS